MPAFKWDKIFITAVIIAIVGQIIHWLASSFSMGYYVDPGYAGVWSKIMMPSAGPPPPSFLVYSLAFGFVSAFLLTFVFVLISPGLKGRNWLSKGAFYSLVLFLVAGIPSSFALILLINLPSGLVILWLVESMVVYFVDGLLISLLNKRGKADVKL
ncbi:MAG: hypothetical protein V1743_04195 [Nanoarchaeota archaeon]